MNKEYDFNRGVLRKKRSEEEKERHREKKDRMKSLRERLKGLRKNVKDDSEGRFLDKLRQKRKDKRVGKKDVQDDILEKLDELDTRIEVEES